MIVEDNMKSKLKWFVQWNYDIQMYEVCKGSFRAGVYKSFCLAEKEIDRLNNKEKL